MRKVIAVRKDSYSVLIVDADEAFADTLGMRVIARSNLTLCGKVYSGDAVLPVVREKRPEIIIMDLTLPALDGISVIRMLQKELTYKPIIIITSAYSNEMQRYLINDIPNAYFVRKPVSCEHLLDRTGELVRAAMESVQGGAVTCYEEVLRADREARAFVRSRILHK